MRVAQLEGVQLGVLHSAGAQPGLLRSGERTGHGSMPSGPSLTVPSSSGGLIHTCKKNKTISKHFRFP